MARLNVRNTKPLEYTHEGAPASHMNVKQALRRSVMANMLWESEFYEDGVSIANRIENLAAQADSQFLADLAVEARSDMNLRHVPLLLLKSLIKKGYGQLVSNAITNTIQRADELAELLAVYWKDGKQKMSNPLRKGLAKAFLKFDEYQLAKYNRDGAIKLRDVLFLSHAKPDSPERDALFKRLINGTLKTPDTWEVELSGGKDKKEVFERLIRERKIGYLALLRNLRNMTEANVDRELIIEALETAPGRKRVLPFRYIAAARAAPSLEKHIDAALVKAIDELPVLPGRTAVLVDISGSMDCRLSGKSDMRRVDAAAALASVINGDVRMFSFTDRAKEVPARRGMAGVEAIINSQAHGGTVLGGAIKYVNDKDRFDRLIVITDEQSHDRVGKADADKAYMINVGSYQNGVSYGNDWIHLDGFSESILRWIHAFEQADLKAA
jgi:60 kDa SS-A/Ro ribonucleoprotein